MTAFQLSRAFMFAVDQLVGESWQEGRVRDSQDCWAGLGLTDGMSERRGAHKVIAPCRALRNPLIVLRIAPVLGGKT